MGMSTRLKLIDPGDPVEHQRMHSIGMLCREQGIDIPLEVKEYFGGFFDETDADPKGIILTVSDYDLRGRPIPNGVSGLGGDNAGFEVNLDELPKQYRIIRFENSW